MAVDEGRDVPVRAKAIVVDPGTMTVLWANEAAAEAASVGTGVIVGEAVERVISLAEQLALAPAIERVAATGGPYHVRADVIPTRRSVANDAILTPGGADVFLNRLLGHQT